MRDASLERNKVLHQSIELLSMVRVLWVHGGRYGGRVSREGCGGCVLGVSVLRGGYICM